MRQRWLGLDATVGGFIYSKSAGEPLKDSAQSSQLMELLFLKTQWLMCGEQVNRHRSRKVSEKLFQLIQAEREGAWPLILWSLNVVQTECESQRRVSHGWLRDVAVEAGLFGFLSLPCASP